MSLTFSCSRSIKPILVTYLQRTRHRRFATKSSNEIRKEFVEFFMNKHDHVYVRSSPVIPFCDPTVPFVNAGMNQFKGVFLGQYSPPDRRIVNSQKCIRVGGNHNDLEIVGSDGHHHTFFEMLGNWSFGDYYKEEACKMALELLTGPFGFKRDDLVITYFSGDKNLKLESDYECRDIWLKLGISEKNLFAKGVKDNFWEMGSTGPCGPCTEIHFRESSGNLIEVWNLVFIQFNRLENGDIIALPKYHVDTGMGLERITALLQNKNSNYETDLFKPIIETIHKKAVNVPKYNSKFGKDADLDKAYRVLADHARMISVSLADGVFPCRNLRLRNILRKSISLSKEVFHCESEMLIKLYDQVAEILGPTYPELYNKMNHSKEIIMHEEQSLANLESVIKKDRKTLLKNFPETKDLPNELFPGLAEGYKQFKMEMKNVNDRMIPGKIAFKLYDTFGLDNQMINAIAKINGLTIDEKSFEEHLSEHKLKHKSIISKTANLKLNRILNDRIDELVKGGLSPTDDSYKYNYTLHDNDKYVFPPVESQVLAIITDDGNIINSIDKEDRKIYHIVCDKSNFYCEEGGQYNDVGSAYIENERVFDIESVSKIQGMVVHSGTLPKSSNNHFKVGDSIKLVLDNETRFSTMQHHTATHLLNIAIRKVLPQSVACQLSSKVTKTGLMLDLAIYGEKLSLKTITQAQNLVRLLCKSDVPVKIYNINSQDLLRMNDVLTVPGEIYPDVGLRMVEIELPQNLGVSRELCCGTHILNTRHLLDFCITSVRGAKGHTPIIRAVTGERTLQIYDIKRNAENLYKYMEENEVSDEEIKEKITGMRNNLNEICKGEGAAYGANLECLEIFDLLEKKVKEKNEKLFVELVRQEMEQVNIDIKTNHIVHFLVCSYLLEPSNLSLTIAAECSIDRPILLMGCANGIIKATCQVPRKYLTNNFNAEKWISCILPVFETNIVPRTKRQNTDHIVHMKGVKVSLINCESLVARAIKEANDYAQSYCPNFIDSNQTHYANGQRDRGN